MIQESTLPLAEVSQVRIDALCIRALFARARKGAMLAPLAILFMGWMERDVAGLTIVLVWMMLNALPDLINFLITSNLIKYPPPDESMPYWHRVQIVIRTVQGAIWGSAAIFFHTSGDHAFVNDLSVLVVLITVSVVSMVNIVPSMRSLVGFSSGILLIPAVYYFCLADTQHVLFGFGLILLWAVILESGRDVYRQFTDGVRWGVNNQESSRQLELRNSQLDELNRQLSSIAIHDTLTGLYNRHFVVEQLGRQHDLFLRYGTMCSIVMLDIDHFKQVNDQYGHAVGDSVLIAFGQRVESALRQGDIFARYGGEEFLLVLPSTDLDAALQLANRIRSKVAGAPMIGQPVLLNITSSFGVAQIRVDEAVDDWLKRADRALYRAKENGRDCVMV